MRYILEIDDTTGIPKLKGFNEDLAVQMAAELELVNKMIGAEGNEKPSEALVTVNERLTKLRNENSELRAQVTTLRADAHKWETLNHARGREMRALFGFDPSMKYEQFLEKLKVLGDAYQQAKKDVEQNTLSLRKLQQLEKQFAPYIATPPIIFDRAPLRFNGWGN